MTDTDLNGNCNKNSDNTDNSTVEEPNAAQQYINKFFYYLYKETGFTKKSFTAKGLEEYLKKAAKNCFQLQILDDLLQSLFKIVQIFGKSINDKIERAAEIFVKLLHSITTFLMKYYLGRGFLILTANMSVGMVAFLIGLFHVVMFIYENWSYTWFLKLKEWIIMLLHNEKVKRFFEDVFPNYGRALPMA